jgi:hypothetical protein
MNDEGVSSLETGAENLTGRLPSPLILQMRGTYYGTNSVPCSGGRTVPQRAITRCTRSRNSGHWGRGRHHEICSRRIQLMVVRSGPFGVRGRGGLAVTGGACWPGRPGPCRVVGVRRITFAPWQQVW